MYVTEKLNQKTQNLKRNKNKIEFFGGKWYKNGNTHCYIYAL